MSLNIENATDILKRTPDILSVLLHDAKTKWTTCTEGPDTWSPYDVIGHLIHGEKTDWLTRIKIVLSDDPDKKFQPFDRFAQFNESRGKSINMLLGEFKELRQLNLSELQKLSISTEQLSFIGIHPDFGKVSIENLIASWAVHDLTHIAQIARVMAKQYDKKVGPFKAYLGILNK